jgi:hypothetical protein
LVDDVNDKFTEAREEIDCAMESAGSTYFNDDAEYARECVKSTLEAYDALLESLENDEARASTRRSMGMKMEQLKGELARLDHAHDDDH